MPETAFQTQYRQESIASFERRQSVLRECCVTEAVIKGNQAVFLVAGSGGATAQTRGVDGLIPSRADDLNQYTCVLSEWHDLVKKTGFNIFASQGDQNKIMQQTTMAVLNRKIDDQVIAELATCTMDTGAAAPASLNLVTKAKVILGNNNAGGGSLHAIISPAFDGYLHSIPEFASRDYVPNLKFDRTTNKGVFDRYRWWGIDWIVHTGIVGMGTADELCYMWNQDAMGHAADTKGLKTPVGYDDEQDYSYARASLFMGAKLLQNSGIVQIHHDGSAFAAS